MIQNFSLLAGYFMAGLAALSCGMAERAAAQPAGHNKPNIIVILPDDLGWGDVGYYGSSVKTPNIDRLAQTGVRLDQQYVMPTCTPTRVSLMTGKYPSRYGITGPDYGEVIDMGDPTLASVLRENGYYTAIAGKWHMGSPPYTPLRYGFDSSYGYFDGQIDPYTHEYKTETELTGRESWHRNDVFLTEEGHATDLITNEALRIIRSPKEKPFFLYVAYSVPHYPLDEPEEWTSLYDGMLLEPSRRQFAASVTHMDAGIGRILEALEQTRQRDNTLILFISDNGGQFSWSSDTEYRGKYADRPHTVLGNNFPLRGWKSDLYEGGIRVPAIVNWHGTLKPGAMNVPVHVSDWLPTLCSVAGCEAAMESLKTDGKSIWSMVTGKEKSPAQRPMYWKTGQAFAVREGPWKLVLHRKDNKAELFHLENDFRETTDLSGKHPDIVRHLLDLISEFREGDR